jgi:hypothetical protein
MNGNRLIQLTMSLTLLVLATGAVHSQTPGPIEVWGENLVAEPADLEGAMCRLRIWISLCPAS